MFVGLNLYSNIANFTRFSSYFFSKIFTNSKTEKNKRLFPKNLKKGFYLWSDEWVYIPYISIVIRSAEIIMDVGSITNGYIW